MFEEIKMVQNGKVQATKFLREIVEAKKKPTSKDVENYVEMLKTFGMNNENILNIQCEVSEHIQNKITYFQKKQNKEKEEQYKKIRVLNKKFFEFYLEKKETAKG